jgi:c(7)-type cytochrome triheme protein
MRAWTIALLLSGFVALGANVGFAAFGDLVFERPGGAAGFAASVFPHWLHRIRFRCDVCHPAIFEMEKGANAVTMKAINEGEFCGKCHNGKTAFTVEFQNCTRCHQNPTE